MNIRNRKFSWKAVCAVVAITLILAVASTVVLLGSPNGFTKPDIYLDDLPFSASYVVKNNGTYYWAVKDNGQIAVNSTNDDTVIQYAIDGANSTGGGIVVVRAGSYSASVTVKGSVLLLLEVGVSGVTYTLDSTGIAQRYANGYIVFDAPLNMTGHQILEGVFHSGSVLPSNPSEGQSFWRTSDHIFYVWNSTAWVTWDTTVAGHDIHQDYNYLIFESGGTYYAKSGATEQIDYSNTSAGYVTNQAIDALPSTGGHIVFGNGTFEIGTVDMKQSCDSGWVSADAEVTVSHDTTNKKEGSASVKIEISSAHTTGLACYYNFGSAQDFSSYDYIGHWFRCSVSAGYDLAYSWFQIQLDNSPNCASPEYSWWISYPEWVYANNWYYGKPSTGEGAYNIPLSLSGATSIQSIGLKVVTDEGAMTLWLDQIDMMKDWIYVPTGQDYVHISGQGKSTKFRMADGFNSPIIWVRGDHFEADYFSIDGNRGNNISPDVGVGIYLRYSDYANIHNIFSNDTSGQVVYIRGCHNATITENTCWNFENAMVLITYGSDNIVTNNHAFNALNDSPIYIHYECDRNIVANNVLIGATAGGILIDAGAGADVAEDNIVTGNIISSVESYALCVAGETLRTIITDNKISYGGSRGIQISEECLYTEVSDNIVYCVEQNGIHISGSHCKVEDNTVINAGWTHAGSAYVGIQISGTDNKVSGNVVIDDQATKTMQSGISIGSTAYNSDVSDNNILEIAGFGIRDQGDDSSIQSHFITDCGKGIKTESGANYGTIKDNVFRDCTSALDLLGSYTWVDGNDLRDNTDDVENQGTSTIWGINLDRLGAQHYNEAPDV